MNILLCHLIFFIAGLKAEDMPKIQYGLTGGTICLPFTNPLKNITDIKWKFNNKRIVINGEKTNTFKDNFQYNSVNHSLCISGLKDTDTAKYTVSASYKDDAEIDTSYELIVQEAVPEPVMKITQHVDFNSSAGPCIMSVNCSVGKNWAFSVCKEDSQDSWCKSNSSSTTDVFINISSLNGNVTCTGKNNVSNKTHVKSTNDICQEGTTVPDGTSHARSHYEWFLFLIPLIVVILTIGGLKCWRSSQETPGSQTAPGHASVPTGGGQTEAEGTSSVYDEVRDQVNGPTSKEPETSIYSIIQKPKSAVEANMGGTIYSTLQDACRLPERDKVMSHSAPKWAAQMEG